MYFRKFGIVAWFVGGARQASFAIIKRCCEHKVDPSAEVVELADTPS
jgi:hypothetical protein